MDPPVRRKTGRRRSQPETLPAVTAQRPSRRPVPNAVLARRGILPQQAAQGDTTLPHLLYQSVGPMEAQYYEDGDFPSSGPRSALGMFREVAQGVTRRARHGPRVPKPGDEAQEDAYRMYLGLPQITGTWRVSDSRPSRSTDPRAIYYSDPGLRNELDEWEGIRNLYARARAAEGGRMVMDLNDAGPHGQALSQATIGAGEDERGPYLSVYDNWNLDVPGERLVGKPFEVYDRYYLNTVGERPPRPPPTLMQKAASVGAPPPQPAAVDAAGWTRRSDRRP